MANETVPRELRKRFTRKEAPTFHLVRRFDDVRLWSSTTIQHEAFGQTRPPVTHFHVTKGQDLRVHHMADLEDAMPNFECHSEAANDIGKAAEVQHG